MEKKKEPFIIDEEMIEKATAYMPLSMKKAIAVAVAKQCLETVDKTTESIATETALPIPQLYKEACGAKVPYLMYYFLTEYLHIELSDDFDQSDYDYYAQFQPLMQLERLKVNCKKQENKNKVFDILYDFKELKKMLDTEIFNLKESKNDTLTRLNDSISLFASPENIKALNELLQRTIGEVEVAQKKLNEKRATAKKSKPPRICPQTSKPCYSKAICGECEFSSEEDKKRLKEFREKHKPTSLTEDLAQYLNEEKDKKTKPTEKK